MFRAENIAISFGKKQVIDGFNICFGQRQKLAVIGRNGSGKTTLALYLSSVIPEFIEANVRGRCNFRRKTGLLMQNPSAQFFSLSVKEELAGLSIDCKRFGISHLIEKTVFELSEGEKQKVNLAVNLSAGFPILALDEPLELLDPLECNRFMKIIEKEKDAALLWFDKDAGFVNKFQKVFLQQPVKPGLPEKKENKTNKIALHADFSFERNGFSLNVKDFRLMQGEKIGLIGANGSGKTTLLKLLAGIEKAEGVIELHQPISFVPQVPSHVFFNETLQSELLNRQNAESLGITGLLQQAPNTLSKGQQKLASIATIRNNGIAFLDEPTTWLDCFSKARVYNFINESRQPMVIATHDRELLRYCDKVFLIEKGGLRQCSNTAVNRFFQNGLNG